MRKEGFTLIELMIVIAIIAIIAAIAIPNLLTGRMSANESTALAGLKTLTSQEAIWRQGDLDGNGIKDYWTYDVSCFNRMYRADGTTKVNCIDISFARADANPADDAAITAPPAMEPWDSGDTAISPTAKSGYWYTRLVTTFIGSGEVYQDPDNTVGANSVAACNSSLYAFAAKPHAYAASGVLTFIVNEGGTVYSTDAGDQNDDWFMVTGDANAYTWPAATAGGAPTLTTGLGGRKYAPAD